MRRWLGILQLSAVLTPPGWSRHRAAGLRPTGRPVRQVRVVASASHRPLKSEAPVTPPQPRPRLQRHRAQGKQRCPPAGDGGRAEGTGAPAEDVGPRSGRAQRCRPLPAAEPSPAQKLLRPRLSRAFMGPNLPEPPEASEWSSWWPVPSCAAWGPSPSPRQHKLRCDPNGLLGEAGPRVLTSPLRAAGRLAGSPGRRPGPLHRGTSQKRLSSC